MASDGWKDTWTDIHTDAQDLFQGLVLLLHRGGGDTTDLIGVRDLDT